jgi:hypothetical protein
LDYKSKKLDFTGASKSVIDRKTKLVGYSFFDTFDDFSNLHSSTMPTFKVNITEDRGTPTPTPPTMGGEGNRAARTDGEWLFSVLFSALAILVSITQI